MTKPAPIPEPHPMVARLARILQAGLEAHEHVELTRRIAVVDDLCEALGLTAALVPMEQKATLVFSYALFGAPLTRAQEHLQTATLERLAEAGDRIVYRQVREEPLRAWRLRSHSGAAVRDIAHAISGPERDREEHVDIALGIDSGEVLVEGDVLGWPVQEDGDLLLVAWRLGPESAKRVEALSPFPAPWSERSFWGEQTEELLQAALSPDVDALFTGIRDHIAPSVFRDGEVVPSEPAARPGEMLERLVQAAGLKASPPRTRMIYRRWTRGRWPREIVALAETDDELEPLLKTLHDYRYWLLGWSMKGRFADADDPALEEWLPIERVMEAFGVCLDATMPGADDSVLLGHPWAVLGLEENDEVQPEEPIRRALAWARSKDDACYQEIDTAWRRYRAERRWCATYGPVDTALAAHLERVDLEDIMHGLQTLFEPALLNTPLEHLTLEPRFAGRFETALRTKPYTDENIVCLASIPEREATVLGLRNVGLRALNELKRALLDLADRWRGERHGVHPGALQSEPARVALGSSLQDGLDELAALFSME